VKQRIVTRLLIGTCVFGACCIGLQAAESGPKGITNDFIVHYGVLGGMATLELDAEAASAAGLNLAGGTRATFVVDAPESTFRLRVKNDDPEGLSGALVLRGEMAIDLGPLSPADRQGRIGDLSVTFVGRSAAFIDGRDFGRDVFEMVRDSVAIQLNGENRSITISGQVAIGRSLARDVLENDGTAGQAVGTAVIHITREIVDVDMPLDPSPEGEGDGGGKRAGADVICGDLTGPSNYGQETSVQKCSYSIGTTSCNIGTVPLNWIDGTPNHPVMALAIYRWKMVNGSGRFEQLGQSWMKWAFCALQGGLCSPPNCQPVCGGCCSQLGVGCSDPYTSARNGSQIYLGPKSVVNPSTAAFPAGHATPGGGRLPGRIQVNVADLDPAQNSGAVYYGEGQYLAPDDAAAGNKMNNCSYRRFSSPVGAAPSYNLNFSGTSTVRTQPAIFAWANHESGVTFINWDVSASDGRFVLAYKTTALGGNMWHYEYSIYNLNSDRAGQAFSVPVPNGVTLSNIGFRDVDYWAEPYSGTDWTPTQAGGQITWATQTQAQNPNANALRFGTLYNFRFDANAPPALATARLTLFKAGSPTELLANIDAPSIPCNPPSIDPLGTHTTVCGQPWSSSVPTASGDGPFTWSIVGAPAGVTINPATGQVSWTPTASKSPHVITIRATSQCGGGFDDETFNLLALPGDFNGDGMLTSVDVGPLVDHLVGLSSTTLCAADVDEDGSRNGHDAEAMVGELIP